MASLDSISKQLDAEVIARPGVFTPTKFTVLGGGAFAVLTVLVLGILALALPRIPFSVGITLSALSGAGFVIDSLALLYLVVKHKKTLHGMKEILNKDDSQRMIKDTFSNLHLRIENNYLQTKLGGFIMLAVYEKEQEKGRVESKQTLYLFGNPQDALRRQSKLDANNFFKSRAQSNYQSS